MKATLDKQALAKDDFAQLIFSRIEQVVDDEAIVYYKYPFFRGDIESETVEAKLLLVSPVYGIIFFDLDSKGVFDDITTDRVGNLYNEISTRMSKFPSLRKHLSGLKYNIVPIIVGGYEYREDDGFILCNADEVPKVICAHKRDNIIPDDDFRLIVGCIEGTARMNPKKERRYAKPDTKAYILNEIQNHIANFDQIQKEAAIIDVDLPQRIRGLAGSGKTIVLAYKAALYHLHNPNDTILYTFFTKSLADTVKKLIRRVYGIYSNNQEPNWENISVIHGWGGTTMEGVYYNACLDNNISPKTLQEARGHGKDSFAYICEELVKNELAPKYDLVLIDEGQDFPVEFYRLCYRLCKSKRICWAYDDFQNIFEVDIQDEHQTFGFDEYGKPMVDLSVNSELQDIVLDKCYRTPRYVLISAFALGLGIYYDKVLQRIDTVQLWESLGFRVEKGNCETGADMIVSRPEENTPSYSNEKFKDTSIQTAKCNSIEEECQLIAREITNCINVDGLIPTDICVICLDMKRIEAYFSGIRKYLLKNSISVFDLNQAPYANTAFFRDGYVTLSTVNKAKGNECGVVFICGIDAIFNMPDNVVMRDKLFTSMTRTKGWLYLSGCGEGMEKFLYEAAKLRENGYKLVFKQPNKTDTKNIENVSKQRQVLDKSMLQLLDKFKDTGMTEEEILEYITRNLKN